MRNRRLGRKIGVKTKHRKALLRNLTTELFRHGKIKTTDAKAKEIKRVADKLVTLAKNSAKADAPDAGLSSKRRIFSYITDKEVARKVFTEIAEMHKQRPGGYSRIVRLGFRRGDQTPVSQIELVTEPYQPSPKTDKKKKSNLPLPPKQPEQDEQDVAPTEEVREEAAAPEKEKEQVAAPKPEEQDTPEEQKQEED